MNPFDIDYSNHGFYVYYIVHIFMYIYGYYNLYSDWRPLCVMHTMTRRLGKYLKVHSRRGTHIFNDDHLLVPNMNMVPDCQYTQENVLCLSNVPSIGLQDLANRTNEMEECNSCSPIIFYICGSEGMA